MDSSGQDGRNEEINGSDIEDTEVVEVVEVVDESDEDDANNDSVIDVNDSVQIAPTVLDNDESLLIVELGDRVVIDSKKYGRTVGTVYYRSLDAIRIKPDGVSNLLHTFEVEQTDTEELYKEEDGVTAVFVIQKRNFPSFVEQQDFRVNQVVDTFDTQGQLYQSYKIIAVKKEEDAVQLQDIADESVILDIVFNYTGIESDEDFVIMSVRYQTLANATNAESFQEQKQENQDQDQNQEEEEEEEDEGIEVVGFVEVMPSKIFKEAAAYEQQIPDHLQRIDALNDFISSLDARLQKDPKTIRSIRILIETLFHLKQATIQYASDGTTDGLKRVSADTLIDLIENTSIPLGRPVLHMTKKEYTDEEDIEEQKEDPDTQNHVYFESFLAELEQMQRHSSLTIADKSVIREWNEQRGFLKQFASPWRSVKTVEPLWRAIKDSDVFRQLPPVEGLLPIIAGHIPSHDVKVAPILDKVPFGIERALSTTFRKGKERKKQVLLEEDSATMHSYLLFPLRTANYLGTTRSYSIAMDSGRSQLPPKTMRTLLEETGEPKEIGMKSTDVILLGASGNTLGNIPLADYLDGLSIPALGFGDTFETLQQYGITNMEINEETALILEDKITRYQSQLITTLATLRNIIETTEIKEPEQNPLIESPSFLEIIRAQPILVESLLEYERCNPSLRQSDLGIVIHFLRTYANYFQVAVGQNPVLIAKAILDANSTRYVHDLKCHTTIKNNEAHAGIKPIKNPCKHVAQLVSIRKIYDMAERFQELTKFFKIYQGARKDNWIECTVCHEHLLCLHERLQLQAFLTLKEKDIIEKEIILKFSGGQFQGKYICRNCGQAIKDLDFDNNMEFDDNGKPKSAVMVDEDALLEDKIDMMVSVPIEDSQKKELSLNEDETKCYYVIRELADRVGVLLDNESYKNCISQILSAISKYPSKSEYDALKKKVAYNEAINRNIIAVSAALLLIEIQCKVPSYPVRYTMIPCDSRGFDGFPLEEGKQGIEYLACAVASVNKDQAPWNESGFQRGSDDAKRKAGIAKYIADGLSTLVDDDWIQARLAQKRKYLEESFAELSQGGNRDKIFPSFLPEQLILTPEESAKDIIIPEVEEHRMNPLSLTKLWIRMAHLDAKKTTPLIRGSPYIESTCCLKNIQTPEFTLPDTPLPTIQTRKLQPNQQGHFLLTPFVPRDNKGGVVEPDKNLYYRIFLKYCFQGKRKGYPHEVGLTHQCAWCGFQFPTHPSVMDTDTEGKSALESQEVKTNTEEFTDLLDTIHTVNQVESVKQKGFATTGSILKELGEIEPAPTNQWKEMMQQTTLSILQLAPDAERDDVLLATGLLSEVSRESEDVLKRYKKLEKYLTILHEISNLSWMNFFQVLQNYFITPFQRIISGFSTESLFIPIELEKALSQIHTTKDLQPILNSEVDILLKTENMIKLPKYDWARDKIREFVKQLSILLPFKNKIRPILVPGKENTLKYIQKALLFGPLATLLSRDNASAIDVIANDGIVFILQMLMFTMNKYYKERLSFDDKKIKDLIAIRDEKERVNVVEQFNKLTDEERAIELMNKSLGIGKWAVGGTKLIYAYDKDYYDKEREKRLMAGITDFPGHGNGEMMAPEGRELDDFGYPEYSDEYFEREGGYEHNQHADDDYE